MFGYPLAWVKNYGLLRSICATFTKQANDNGGGGGN